MLDAVSTCQAIGRKQNWIVAGNGLLCLIDGAQIAGAAASLLLDISAVWRAGLWAGLAAAGVAATGATGATAKVWKGVQIVGNLVIPRQRAAGIVVHRAVGADVCRAGCGAGLAAIAVTVAITIAGVGIVAWIIVCHGFHLF